MLIEASPRDDVFGANDPAWLSEEALDAHPSFASTLGHGLGVLGCFSGVRPSLGNKDIADQLGLSKPTVSRLTFTLVALGYLRKDAETGKYQLGPAVLSLGYPLLSQLTLRQVASNEMLELSRLAQGPVSVGARDRMQVVYVETMDGGGTSITKPGVGSTRPMLQTAMGRALMAAHPEPTRSGLEKRLREKQPEQWAAYSVGLLNAYEDIRTLGFCTVVSEWRPTLAAVAVPMTVPLHGLHLAFNLTVPIFSDQAKVLREEYGPRLVELVRRVEAVLGF